MEIQEGGVRRRRWGEVQRKEKGERLLLIQLGGEATKISSKGGKSPHQVD